MVGFSSQEGSIVLLLLLSAMTLHIGKCCNANDRSALQIFRQSVIDQSNKLSTWSTEEDCCAWKGVQCDNITGRVTKLDLKQNYLQGEINLSLLELEFLNYLDLSLNGFGGITQKYGNQSKFSNLHYLDLSFNDDFHMDNLHWLSKLSSLKCLNLSQINLQNESNWLQSMTMHPSLSELRLASCHLTDISPSTKYVNFTSLVTLDLSGNHFETELPDWLFNLSSHISHIDLSFNFLQGQLPKSLLNLRKLKSLKLNDNELNGSIPDWLDQHENLQHLGLSDNLFHGFIPSTLGNLSSLVELEISSNFLSGSLPNSLGELLNLRNLFIGGNSLSGVVSEKHFSKLSNLETLVLSSPFKFDLDPNWIPPFQLQGISLSKTLLGPNFPEWLYTQRSLKYLEVPSSGISSINGDIFWSFIANITQVNLSNNSISADLSNVTLNSELIFMDHNNFTGELPHITENVTYLDMSHNSFHGSISPLFCHKVGSENSLDYLDISFNLLIGIVPDCWEYWKGLSFLFMESNNLIGEIPPSMGSFIDLIALDLHNNSLSGEFSLDLTNIKNLQFINIADNNFSGNVPVKMPQSMEVMMLRSNQFSGEIPEELCDLSSLIEIDLSHNKLSGTIPKCVTNITAMGGVRKTSHYPFEFNMFSKGQDLEYEDYGLLRTLDLSSNYLSGEIPLEVFGLVQLQLLNLSRNHLNGKIPRRIGEMKQLESLDISDNKLSGEIPPSISSLSFLSYLNLSYNDFSGQIPLGTQLQSFEAWSYAGNPRLCGAPLTMNCTEEKNHEGDKIENDETEIEFLYLGMGVGFAVGFWAVCGSLFFIKSWRHIYFRFIAHVADKIYVVLVLKFNRFGESGASST